jgi:hypothetical protein
MKRYFFGNEELPSAVIGDVQVVRDPAGVWRYVDTWVAVPGVREATLTERFAPKFIVNADNEVERVVVDGAAIQAAPELLSWCLDEGTVIRDGEEVTEVLVPHDLWKENERIPNELFSPEHQGDKAEREVAAAERNFREIEKSFEVATKERAHVLRRHADDMTRQRAREITGLSVGRVQQLIRSEYMDGTEREVLELFESGLVGSFDALVELAQEKGMSLDNSALMARVDDLRDRGLLEETEDLEVGLTAEGAKALLEARVLGQRVEFED